MLQLLRNVRPQLRYAIACCALSLCIFLPLQTVISHIADGKATKLIAESLTGLNSDPTSHANLFLFSVWIQTHLMALVAVWAVCVALFAARLALGLVWIARIANPGHSLTNASWQARLDQLTQRNGIQRKIALREVNNLESPAVAGWLRPVILVPTALITGMPPDLLEALLAHEVAHIQRMDYIVNLLQSAVEILLFYHPAVWWISRQIRIEREQIADDLAAQMIAEPRRLAVALSELERVQFANNQLSMSANGGDLVQRIKRLTQPGIQPIGYKAIVPAVSLLLASIAFYANAATDTTAGPAVQAKTVHAIINFQACDKPEYPKQSFANKDEGTVHMTFSIDVTGRINSSKIEHSSGHPELDQAALSALNKCSFTPATKNGKAVASSTFVDYVWKLPN
jgi:bla regulator protein BlaR1